MTKFLLSVHVLVAIIAIGPVTVAASMFPATLRRALGEPGAGDARTTLRTLHRICRVYAGIGIAVPVFGFATASSLGVLGDAWKKSFPPESDVAADRRHARFGGA